MAITWQTRGTAAASASNGTLVTVPYPASSSEGDKLIMIIGQKPVTANGGTCTTPANWTLVGSIMSQGGYGTTLGPDTGNTNIYVYERTVPAGGLSGSLGVTIGDNSVSWGIMHRATTDSTWDTVSAVFGGGNQKLSTDMPLSVGSTTLEMGDAVLGAFCAPTDATTGVTGCNFFQSGTFFSTVTSEYHESGNGLDIDGVTFESNVVSDGKTADLGISMRYSGTLTNCQGPGCVVVVRDNGTYKRTGTYAHTFVSGTSTDGNNFSLTLPTLLPDDIVLVLTGWSGTSDGTPGVTTSGYSELAELYDNTAAFDTNMSVSWKRMGDTPDTSVTCIGSGDLTTDPGGAIAYIIRGVDPGTAIDVTTTTADSSIDYTNPDPPSITPTTANSLVVICSTSGEDAGYDGAVHWYDPPTGYHDGLAVADSVGSNVNMLLLGAKKWTSGAEDPAVWSANRGESWCAATIAFRNGYGVVATGGGIAGGSATFTVGSTSASITGSGGGIAGGTATFETISSASFSSTGGGVISGSATYSLNYTTSFPGSGGGVAGGISDFTVENIFTPIIVSINTSNNATGSSSMGVHITNDYTAHTTNDYSIIEQDDEEAITSVIKILMEIIQ